MAVPFGVWCQSVSFPVNPIIVGWFIDICFAP